MLILIKWPYYLLLIVYLNVSPYLLIKNMSTNQMFFLLQCDLCKQMWMAVETLFLITISIKYILAAEVAFYSAGLGCRTYKSPMAQPSWIKIYNPSPP